MKNSRVNALKSDCLKKLVAIGLAVLLAACVVVDPEEALGPAEPPVPVNRSEGFTVAPTENGARISWANPARDDIAAVNISWAAYLYVEANNNHTRNATFDGGEFLNATRYLASGRRGLQHNATGLDARYSYLFAVNLVLRSGAVLVLPPAFPDSGTPRRLGPNFDGDSYADVQDIDDDNDGVPDLQDPAQFNPTISFYALTNVTVTSTEFGTTVNWTNPGLLNNDRITGLSIVYSSGATGIAAESLGDSYFTESASHSYDISISQAGFYVLSIEPTVHYRQDNGTLQQRRTRPVRRAFTLSAPSITRVAVREFSIRPQEDGFTLYWTNPQLPANLTISWQAYDISGGLDRPMAVGEGGMEELTEPDFNAAANRRSSYSFSNTNSEHAFLNLNYLYSFTLTASIAGNTTGLIFPPVTLANNQLLAFGINTDGDGLADLIDPDDDNDGFNDTVDAYPLDVSRSHYEMQSFTITEDGAASGTARVIWTNPILSPGDNITEISLVYRSTTGLQPVMRNLTQGYLASGAQLELIVGASSPEQGRVLANGDYTFIIRPTVSDNRGNIKLSGSTTLDSVTIMDAFDDYDRDYIPDISDLDDDGDGVDDVYDAYPLDDDRQHYLVDNLNLTNPAAGTARIQWNNPALIGSDTITAINITYRHRQLPLNTSRTMMLDTNDYLNDGADNIINSYELPHLARGNYSISITPTVRSGVNPNFNKLSRAASITAEITLGAPDFDGDHLSDFLDQDDDNDGMPDEVDTDDDNDGTPDTVDAYPLDDSRQHYLVQNILVTNPTSGLANISWHNPVLTAGDSISSINITYWHLQSPLNTTRSVLLCRCAQQGENPPMNARHMVLPQAVSYLSDGSGGMRNSYELPHLARGNYSFSVNVSVLSGVDGVANKLSRTVNITAEINLGAPDFDGDHLSDFRDPDDDNDGAPDIRDAYPLDRERQHYEVQNIRVTNPAAGLANIQWDNPMLTAGDTITSINLTYWHLKARQNTTRTVLLDAGDYLSDGGNGNSYLAGNLTAGMYNVSLDLSVSSGVDGNFNKLSRAVSITEEITLGLPDNDDDKIADILDPDDDNDGTPDAMDEDIDGDRVNNAVDAYPNDSSRTNYTISGLSIMPLAEFPGEVRLSWFNPVLNSGDAITAINITYFNRTDVGIFGLDLRDAKYLANGEVDRPVDLLRRGNYTFSVSPQVQADEGRGTIKLSQAVTQSVEIIQGAEPPVWGLPLDANGFSDITSYRGVFSGAVLANLAQNLRRPSSNSYAPLTLLQPSSTEYDAEDFMVNEQGELVARRELGRSTSTSGFDARDSNTVLLEATVSNPIGQDKVKLRLVIRDVDYIHGLDTPGRADPNTVLAKLPSIFSGQYKVTYETLYNSNPALLRLDPATGDIISNRDYTGDYVRIIARERIESKDGSITYYGDDNATLFIANIDNSGSDLDVNVYPRWWGREDLNISFANTAVFNVTLGNTLFFQCPFSEDTTVIPQHSAVSLATPAASQQCDPLGDANVAVTRPSIGQCTGDGTFFTSQIRSASDTLPDVNAFSAGDTFHFLTATPIDANASRAINAAPAPNGGACSEIGLRMQMNILPSEEEN